MKSISFIVAVSLISSGCTNRALTGQTITHPFGCEHTQPTVHTPEPTRSYLLVNGAFVVKEQKPADEDSINNVRIQGAVRRPGVYCFQGEVLIEDIINASEPFPEIPDSSHTCGSAVLTRILFESAVVDGQHTPLNFVIDFADYMKPREDGSLKNRFLIQGGVIIVPGRM